MKRAPVGVAAALLCVLLLGGIPAGADSPLAGPHALDDGMQAARAQLDAGDCKEGVEALKALLAQHEGKDYAKARRIEIEELMRSLVCGTKFKRPKAKDLVSGKLQSWSPKTGKIKITYTPKKVDDLLKRDGLLVLPGRFSGPVTIEIKGSRYPKDESETPRVAFGGDQHPETGKDQSWRVAFGLPERKGRGAAKIEGKIIYSDGGAEKTLAKKSNSAGKLDKPYKVSVKVTKTKISVQLNGRSYGSAKKDKALFGYLGFRAGKWTEAKVTGTIEPTWIQGQLDVVLQTQLDELAKTYKPSEHLPGWLSQPLRKERSKPSKPAVDLVAKLSEKHYGLMMDVDNDLREDEFDKAFARIDKMQSVGAPEATCEYLRAEARRFMNQLDAALKHLERCLELEPEYLDAFLKRGALLRELGRFDEALTVFEQAMGAHAQYPSTYEEAASSMLMAGRPGDASRMTRLAARNGVYSPKLLTLNDALGKVMNGPLWRRKFEHRSSNYHVLSDMDQVICIEASKLLEEAFEAYRKKIGWVARDKTRLFRVYLFSTHDGFMAYQGHLSEFMGKPTDKAAGLYSPLLKQLLIWNLPRRKDMFETIRHEGFHQYLDRIMPNPPTWLNEGMAVYHENARKEDGKLTFGHLHPNYVRLLMQRGFRPLKEFLYGGARPFYEDGHRSYGQAWLMVHMLQHTTPEYRKIFDGLMKDLQTEAAYGVVRRWIPEDSLPKLAQDLKDYMHKLDD